MLLLLALAVSAEPEVCRPCHDAIVRAYLASPMGRSLGRPQVEAAGHFEHRRSGSHVWIDWSPQGSLLHRIERRQSRVAARAVEWAIGSGRKGRSYLVWVQGRLFQSPVSWYAERQTWDVSPGYEEEHELLFNRPVTTECLFCHSGAPRPVPQTLNTYLTPPFAQAAIHCARCHGDSGPHLNKPGRGNIVNPSRLPPRERDSICEQCHLAGEARIPNPGKTFWSFQPGQALESALTIVVNPLASQQALAVVSHVEQLAASRCAQASGARLWCATCHQPHTVEPNDVSKSCRSCHIRLATHPAPTGHNCVGCHMPRRQVSDVRHAVYTDHRILRRPAARLEPTPPRELRFWRPPAAELARRNLGLAYIGVGRKYSSAELVERGFALLVAIEPQLIHDPPALTALGWVLLAKGRPVEAARLFARAWTLEPADARHALNLGIAQQAGGRWAEAAQTLERAVELDEMLEDAWRALIGCYLEWGRTEQAHRAQQRFQKLFEQ